MKLQFLTHGLMMAAVAGLVGCAGNNPVATGDNAQAPQPDRQVLATGTDIKQDVELENAIKQLPQRISAADAERMLIQIDPEKINDDGSEGYSVQRWGGRYGRYGGYRGYGRGFYGGFRYYGYGGRYFPYYASAGYYYPYFSGGYYPYLSLYNSLYSPYSYYNPYFSYYSPYTYAFNRFRWPGIYI